MEGNGTELPGNEAGSSMDTDLQIDHFEELAKQFKVLAEPARLQILSALCHQERSVQDICQRTGLHQGNVSKHLRLMKDAGVVNCRRVGVWRYYRVVDQDLLHLCSQRQKHRQC